jgi:hypothetical protein
MAGWLIPALKAVLLHVGTIISAAKPVFTKKSDETGANQRFSASLRPSRHSPG